jgi:hypothetical protein
MNFWRVTLAVILLGIGHRTVYGQVTAAAPRYGAAYAEIKTYHEQAQALDLSASAEDRLANLRNILRAKYGDRGLNSLFKNLAGPGAIDPTIPGVEMNLRLTTSDSSAVAKGHLRSHLYATKLFHDPRFRLLGMDQPTATPIGATDKDIVYLHVSTGTTGRIEVKEVAPESQRANLPTYKMQLEKMALARERTGELQTWANRKEIIPELREFGERLGVSMRGNVVTGEQSRLKQGTKTIESLYDELDARHAIYGRARVIEGSASAAFGVLLLYQSGPAALSEGKQFFDPIARSTDVGLKFGRDVSYTVAGLALTAKGTAILAARLSSNPVMLGRLTTIGRFSGPIATLAFLTGEGFAVSRYFSGYISGREFAIQSAGLAGGFAGSIAGGWAGAKAGGTIGSLVGGPWGASIGAGIGGVLGGVAGVYAGSSLASSGMTTWFEPKDAEQQESLRQFIYSTYGVAQ